MSLAFEKPLRRIPAPLSLACALALAAPIGAGCGGDDDGGTEVDAGDGEIDASAECVPTDVLPATFRPIDSVATPALTPTEEDGVTTAVVDATAGGFGQSADNPFLYIDLEAGAKVDVTDVDALTSDDWDIAFKRSTIRLNGGDSGPGGVAVAVVEGSLGDAIEEPAATELREDDWVSEDCELIAERDESPATAISEWYDYDKDTMALTPKPIVHVIRTRSGSFVKLVIDSYYDESVEPRVSAKYTVRWTAL